ncbi:MAG: hypothetical protein JSU65_05355 [Candidatus Zixiibacteriota bacterium]|nr:MAG: hypothetical protein JSU65_05355 [candidate division Zixibacteria bacterium]
MLNLYAIYTIARFEAKLLFRSWAFRIFSLLGLIILVFFSIAFALPGEGPPHYVRALSCSLVLTDVKLLNIYVGIIAAFLATEFIKRDRKHDTTQVTQARSYSNLDYITGKVAGILSVFAVLHGLVLLQAAIVDLFFLDSLFAWQAYVYFTALISLPTLVFVIGISFLLVTLLRSQALVFALMLGYSLLVLIFLGSELFYVFDVYAFYQPMIYSGIIGLGHAEGPFLLRGFYFFVGVALIAATVLLTRRLRQSTWANVGAASVAVGCLVAATLMITSHLETEYAGRDLRNRMRASAQKAVTSPAPTVTSYEIDLHHGADTIAADVDLMIVNSTEQELDSLLFSLNPSLHLSLILSNGKPISSRRELQLVWLKPDQPVAPGDSMPVRFSYSGQVDSRYCYLDIEDEQYEKLYRLWLYTIPKKYAFITSDYVHLTPEAGWYPTPGLSSGAAFPAAARQNWSDYKLSVLIPRDMSAISQGDVMIDSTDLGNRYTFRPESRLPQISLTLGKYEHKSLEVDSVNYSIHYLPGHDFFMPFFDELTDTLPALIRELRNDYEVTLGLDYPFERLSIVEVPIQFYSYDRLWTVTQDMVQPEIVFMPEMGTIGAGTDFRQMKRAARRRQERSNQADSPREIQAGYFSLFAKIDILERQTNRWGPGREHELDPRYCIFPNFVTYTSHLTSNRWPIINRAFEAHFAERVAVIQDTRSRRWRGLTDAEEANIALRHLSLADILSETSMKRATRVAALEAKARFILSQMELKIGEEKFASQMNRFLHSNQGRDASDQLLLNFLDSLGDFDATTMFDSWYNDTLLPGYMVEDIECYKVLDGERTRTQVKFAISNPTKLDGGIRVDVRYRRQGVDFRPWWTRGQAQTDYSRPVFVPSMTTKSIGFLVDEPVSVVAIETYASQNIPSVIRISFREQKLRRNELPFEAELSAPLDPDDIVEAGEYLVDNEDAGFDVKDPAKENWLRRTLLTLFGSDREEETYVGMRFWNPPGRWVATTDQNFHGQFVHSAYYKKAGDGAGMATWSADLEEAGNYDVYYYCSGEDHRPWRRRRRRGQTENMGEKHFVVHHEDGVDRVPFDLNGAEEGWNYLGTYRLSAGAAWVELTDRNEVGIVTADAVKWVKR